MYRQSEVARLTERVRRAKERADELVRARLQLVGIDHELEDLVLAIAQLELDVEAERADVEELRGGLRAKVLELIGAADSKRAKEQGELDAVSDEHRAAVARREAAIAERVELVATIERLAGADDELDEAFDDIDAHIAANPGSVDLFEDAVVAMLRAREAAGDD